MSYDENRISDQIDGGLHEQEQLFLSRVSISTLFDDKGKCLKEKEDYFDEEGDCIYWVIISNEYSKYPSDSDIVKMHFAEEYAGETHGNYCARTLFYRAY